MQVDLIKSKKFPRLFLAHADEAFCAMPDVQMLLPSRQLVPVYDLSYAGIAIPSKGLEEVLKPGHYFPASLKINGVKESIALKLRVVKVTANIIGFVFDTMATEGRLVLEQGLKDQLVSKSMRVLPTNLMPTNMQSDIWYHGPFDTNVYIWKKHLSHGILKAVVEYDNLIWIYHEGKVELRKSLSATDESKGYAAPFLEVVNQKVAMGASWLGRLVKVIDQIPDSDGSLKQVSQVLKLSYNV